MIEVGGRDAGTGASGARTGAGTYFGGGGGSPTAPTLGATGAPSKAVCAATTKSGGGGMFGTTPFDGFVEFALIPKPSLNGNTGERIEFGVGKGNAGTNDADLRIVQAGQINA